MMAVNVSTGWGRTVTDDKLVLVTTSDNTSDCSEPSSLLEAAVPVATVNALSYAALDQRDAYIAELRAKVAELHDALTSANTRADHERATTRTFQAAFEKVRAALENATRGDRGAYGKLLTDVAVAAGFTGPQLREPNGDTGLLAYLRALRAKAYPEAVTRETSVGMQEQHGDADGL
mgnify:CR=1 FL=1